MINPDLIGREHELARLRSVLDRAEPAVVIVTGPAGVGRHALVEGACAQAPAWDVCPTGGFGLYVEPRTKVEGLMQRVRAAIGAPAPAGASDGNDPASASSPDAEALAAAMAARPPSVLVLERYRPQRVVDHWLTETLLPALRRQKAAVVLAILDPPMDPTRLTDAAVDKIELGALAVEAVQPHIVSATRSVRPPVEPDELAVYAHAVAARPGTYDSLLRLLALDVADTVPVSLAPAAP